MQPIDGHGTAAKADECLLPHNQPPVWHKPAAEMSCACIKTCFATSEHYTWGTAAAYVLLLS